MQVSKQKLNTRIEKQVYEIFFQLVADLKTKEEAKTLFSDLMTETEVQVMAKRIAIALFLDKGRRYENIKETLKVSSATIASVQEVLANPGMQMALNKIKAEAWANEWSVKISGIFNRLLPR